MRQPLGIPAAVRPWLLADALIGFVHLVNLTLIGWLHRPLVMLDMDYEVNLPTWYATLQLAVVGLLLALFAWTQLRRRVPGAWALFIPASMALYLSLDESAQLHERLRPLFEVDLLPFSGAWMLIAVPLFIVAVAVVIGLTRQHWQPQRVRRLLLAGLVTYVAAAGLLEVPHNFVEPNSFAHLTLIFLEEMGELLAVTLVLWAVHDVLRASGVRLAFSPENDAPDRTR